MLDCDLFIIDKYIVSWTFFRTNKIEHFYHTMYLLTYVYVDGLSMAFIIIFILLFKTNSDLQRNVQRNVV